MFKLESLSDDADAKGSDSIEATRSRLARSFSPGPNILIDLSLGEREPPASDFERTRKRAVLEDADRDLSNQLGGNLDVG